MEEGETSQSKVLKTIVVIFVLLLAGNVLSGQITTNGGGGSQTLESLAPTSVDTLIVLTGDTCEVATTWNAGSIDTTAYAVYVQTGGVLIFTTARANLGSLWLGGLSASPFSSIDGGKLIMGSSDTLGLWNTNALGSTDFNIQGPGAHVDIDGNLSVDAVVMGMDATSRPIIAARLATGIFDANYCKFTRIGESDNDPGITLGAASVVRESADGLIVNCTFDSASVWFHGLNALIMDQCSLFVDRDWPYAMLRMIGIGDTVSNTTFSHDNENNASSHGSSYAMVRVYDTNSFILDCNITNIGVNGELGRAEYCMRVFVDSVTLQGTTIDGAIWGLNSGGSVIGTVVDTCLIINNTHEGILRIEDNLDALWTIQRSVFYGNGFEAGSGYSDILFNIGSTDPVYKGYKLLYNTFIGKDSGDIPVTFRRHDGGSGVLTDSGYTIEGNIFIGETDDIRVALFGGDRNVNVVCDEFKYNAYDDLNIESGSSFRIANDAYIITDSNLSSQTVYDFVDSANFDVRLNPLSPLLDAGGTTLWATTFPHITASTAPGDIGYHQRNNVSQNDVQTILRSWIRMKYDMQGTPDYSLTDTARWDTIAGYYDWLIFGATELRGSYPDPRLNYLKSVNPNILAPLYIDGAYTDTRMACYLHLYADTLGIDMENVYIHYLWDTEHGFAPGYSDSAVNVDKFGLPEADDFTQALNADNDAWQFGRGVYVVDTSGPTWTELTQETYAGTSQTFVDDVDDCLYLGLIGPGRQAVFDLSTGASGDWEGVWEYYDTASGGTWTALSGISDGTSDMTIDGTVTWTPPGELAWQHWFPQSEKMVNHWVRLRCTTKGTTSPVYVSVKGEDFIVANTVPGWDVANDTDGDGVWDTNNTDSSTAIFKWWSRCSSRFTAEYRWKAFFFNKFHPDCVALWKAYTASYVRPVGADGVLLDDVYWHEYDGQFWDNAIGTYPLEGQWNRIVEGNGFASEAEADSLWLRSTQDYQAQAIYDTLLATHVPGQMDTLVGGNISEYELANQYWNKGYNTATPLHNLEIEFYWNYSFTRPSSGGYAIDAMTNAFSAAARGQIVTCSYYYSSIQWHDSVRARYHNFSLASHYLINGPRIYMGITAPTLGEPMGWIDAINYDMGTPVTPNDYTDTATVPWSIWSTQAGDTAFSRAYENCGANNDSTALVVARIRNSVADLTDLQGYALGGSYWRLYSDGFLADPMDSTNINPNDSVSLFGNDGAILVTGPAAAGDPPVEVGGTVTIGGQTVTN